MGPLGTPQWAVGDRVCIKPGLTVFGDTPWGTVTVVNAEGENYGIQFDGSPHTLYYNVSEIIIGLGGMGDYIDGGASKIGEAVDLSRFEPENMERYQKDREILESFANSSPQTPACAAARRLLDDWPLSL